MTKTRVVRACAAILAGLLLAACGNKGPLIRPTPAPGTTPPPPPPTQSNDSAPIPASTTH